MLIVALAWAAADACAQYANVPDEDVFQTTERRYGHLEYFGFYASAMGPWNFTAELAPFTNLTWIHVGSADDPVGAIESMLERLRQARDAGVQGVLSIEPFLFLNDRGDLRPDAEIEDFLVELRARLEAEDLVDTVAMIYPKDEPFRQFVDARNPNFIDKYVTGKVYKDVHAVLVQANSQIKLVFPDKPIGVILSGYDLFGRFFSIPDNYDWVGFDCYGNLFRSCDNRSFTDQYKRLLDFMQPRQRLMAVPETWAWGDNLGRADWPDVLLSRFRHHYEIALNEPRFVAFIPFIWSLDRGVEAAETGLEGFAELYDDGVSNRGTALVDAVKQAGQQIKLGAQEFPNMAWGETEDTDARPAPGLRGEIMSITRSGLVSAWAFDDALPHKNLRVRVLVRDEQGRPLFKSRPERTFVRDPELSQDALIGRPFIGLHGYRYQLPEKLLARYAGHTLIVELLTFADGQTAEVGYIHDRVFRVKHRIRPLLR
jgi:hypothetical protein